MFHAALGDCARVPSAVSDGMQLPLCVGAVKYERYITLCRATSRYTTAPAVFAEAEIVYGCMTGAEWTVNCCGLSEFLLRFA